MLSLGSLFILGGRIGDIFGRRRALLVGIVTFGVASAAAGLLASFVPAPGPSWPDRSPLDERFLDTTVGLTQRPSGWVPHRTKYGRLVSGAPTVALSGPRLVTSVWGSRQQPAGK